MRPMSLQEGLLSAKLLREGLPMSAKVICNPYKPWLMKKTPVTEVKPGSMYGTPKIVYVAKNSQHY